MPRLMEKGDQIMHSEATPNLPTISLKGKNIERGSSSWVLTCNKVRKALEEYGCFVVKYDKVPLELHDNVFDVVEDLFELPSETKSKNTSNKPFHGYYSPLPHSPLLESVGIEDAQVVERTRSFTSLMWPNGNQQFCESVQSYAKLVCELEQLVERMLFESYGVEKYLKYYSNSTSYLLRIAKYRVPNKNETKQGGVCHNDKTFLTILHQNDVSGLEVQTKDGWWVRYKPSAETFVVMAGEPLMAWSNNRIHAPMHHVIMEGLKPRYSLGLFSFINGMIEVPRELVDDEHPLQFKPFDNFGYLHFYSQQVSRISDCCIKDYCAL